MILKKRTLFSFMIILMILSSSFVFIHRNCFYKNYDAYSEFDQATKQLEEKGLYKGILAIGSARIPATDDHILEIEKISQLCAERVINKQKHVSFITGGGPSVMEAWLKPAFKLGAQAAGMIVRFPYEENPTKYLNSYLSFEFNNLATRKSIMFSYARAVVVFKGGYGTMDELFEILTLINIGLLKPIPILIYPADFYKDVLNFSEFVKGKTVGEKELKLVKLIKTKEELLDELYKIIDNSK